MRHWKWIGTSAAWKFTLRWESLDPILMQIRNIRYDGSLSVKPFSKSIKYTAKWIIKRGNMFWILLSFCETQSWDFLPRIRHFNERHACSAASSIKLYTKNNSKCWVAHVHSSTHLHSSTLMYCQYTHVVRLRVGTPARLWCGCHWVSHLRYAKVISNFQSLFWKCKSI